MASSVSATATTRPSKSATSRFPPQSSFTGFFSTSCLKAPPKSVTTASSVPPAALDSIAPGNCSLPFQSKPLPLACLLHKIPTMPCHHRHRRFLAPFARPAFSLCWKSCPRSGTALHEVSRLPFPNLLLHAPSTLDDSAAVSLPPDLAPFLKLSSPEIFVIPSQAFSSPLSSRPTTTRFPHAF